MNLWATNVRRSLSAGKDFPGDNLCNALHRPDRASTPPIDDSIILPPNAMNTDFLDASGSPDDRALAGIFLAIELNFKGFSTPLFVRGHDHGREYSRTANILEREIL